MKETDFHPLRMEFYVEKALMAGLRNRCSARVIIQPAIPSNSQHINQIFESAQLVI